MRFKITLEYDGTRYGGWQLQKNSRTIQGELLEAAFKIFGTQDVEIYGAGRTDAGVHARGQVAHLDVATRLPPEQIKFRLNDELPSDINILHAEPIHPRFHARHDARQRSYVYQISKRRDAFAKRHVWWIKDPLNVPLMRAAGAQLIGFHDFRSFGDTEKDGQSTRVELTRLDIREDADRIYVQITGSHFLWKMVRRIVGTLVEVGRGRMSLETVEGFLHRPSREPAKFTAPPSGLFLERIEY
ncbi:MAG: tRNA pseudouridine(38-40) synthase TruA [Saprospiraceae bacterium]